METNEVLHQAIGGSRLKLPMLHPMPACRPRVP
jgi:hypothetical protein